MILCIQLYIYHCCSLASLMFWGTVWILPLEWSIQNATLLLNDRIGCNCNNYSNGKLYSTGPRYSFVCCWLLSRRTDVRTTWFINTLEVWERSWDTLLSPTSLSISISLSLFCLSPFLQSIFPSVYPGNTKGGSITVRLTSCLTGLD
jgi:hypothetical protein